MKAFPAFGILFGDRARLPELKKLLEDNSNLPGPRANLELAYSFTRSVASMRLEEWQFDALVAMAKTPDQKAPVNTPGEFVPVCALMALGALCGEGLPRPRKRAAFATLRAMAEDPRWRVREGVAMGLQLYGERDLAGLRATAEAWMTEGSFLVQRAVIAALAHPPILSDAEFVRFCLAVSRTILWGLSKANGMARRTEPFRVLRQALGYAVSVFVAALPAEGFDLLRKAASLEDRDVAWVVKENLAKKRLTKSHAAEVKAVQSIVGKRKG